MDQGAEAEGVPLTSDKLRRRWMAVLQSLTRFGDVGYVATARPSSHCPTGRILAKCVASSFSSSFQ